MKPTRRRDSTSPPLTGLTEEQRGALGGRQQPGEHLHRGGLAATIGAEKAENLSALDAEVDVIDGGECAESLGQPMGFDRRSTALGLAKG